ncbi:RagB/SusD family nutrient uptake outer membrane protein [Polaribacter sp. Z014]|uniref:RagB/SusD family nutrient uptake outer membrane protein n=1 Tax=unclassified Polaribacter TaxID=196858 RepID=UPI00193BD7C5|nr:MULTISPECIES: RagB/SusD family nutrient uptake outer membrane protein [unclassified Polaribacter]MCL7764859.1 RagB/SusD family nutrient uptake outer membrane protein [Polaribacter sp. Z014]QVY65028.1 RagB/SusD family nutrient uptake outer membrane protein [Polaribacter sp. Q13]
MKTYKYLFLLLMSLSIVSCSDLIEEPVGVLAPDGFFQTPKDIQTAVDGAFTHAINEKFWGRKLSIALMLRSDMVDLASDESRRREHNEMTTLTDNGMISEFWLKTYQGIAAANLAIDGASYVDVADELKNPVTAQAYFIRAFYYFHLVRQFGAIPYIDAPISDAAAATALSRTPVSEVYTNIISDLEYAKQWLPNTQASRAIPAKSAASSYLALVYLTIGEYQKAFTEAKDVINKKGTYGLDLEPNFQDLFDATKIDASKEPIFALDYNNFEAPNNGYDQIAPMVGIRGNILNGGGWSVAVPALKVYDTWDANDYRRAVSMEDKAVFKGDHDDNPDTADTEMQYDYTQFGIAPGSLHKFAKQRPYIAKYGRFPGAFARGNGRATSHNYSMMRYAEVLLIAAEAAVEINDNSSATTYLNEVRARARSGGSIAEYGGLPAVTVAASSVPADITGTVTVDNVLEERRLELAFECKRWYDIARRKIGTTTFSASGLEGAKAAFSADDYLMPLPGDELERMPNLTQNPGY